MIIKPFLGCAYYPEDWDTKEIAYDIQMMQKAGITCARIGEFAWRKMEPVRGMYDFGWLHYVVDALHEAGIAVILGTPTATPPIWLSRAYPDVLKTGSNHGGRRHCCSNNPHYLEASDAIVHAMGREFGNDPAIIGWQLDNEIYTFGSGCTCEYCVNAFHAFLQEKYGTIDALNAQWNLNLFSQAYDCFDDIPPAVNAWHNPHILLDWQLAHHKADMDFMHRQAAILRQYTDAPIGTDMMPFNGLYYEAMTEPLDVVQFNHYNVPANLTDAVFWFDFLRTLKDRPFWNTETATTWNGSTSIGQVLKPEGYCRVNSWLPIALGGEANMYWLWRQHWAGHELVHGSVLSPEGRPCHVFGEIQQTAAEFAKATDFLNETKVSAKVAMHFTSLSWNLFEQQHVVDGLNYVGEVMGMHKALLRCGICPDVIGAKHSLDDYKLLISPLMMTLEDGDLVEKIKTWVQNGGVWIAGPLTDVRNSIGAHYTDRAMGMLEELLETKLEYTVPTDGSILKAAWQDGDTLTCCRLVECYSKDVGDAWASVTAGHSALCGKTIVGKFPCGKGTVILCGTLPSETDLDKLYRLAMAEAGIVPHTTTGMLVVADRTGVAEGMVLCEVGNAKATIELDTPMKDLLTGTTYEKGTMGIEPYGVYVLEKI